MEGEIFKQTFLTQLQISNQKLNMTISKLGGASGKEPPANAGDVRDRRDARSTPGLGRSLEEEVAIHSSILAWRIPWTKEHGGL